MDQQWQRIQHIYLTTTREKVDRCSKVHHKEGRIGEVSRDETDDIAGKGRHKGRTLTEDPVYVGWQLTMTLLRSKHIQGNQLISREPHMLPLSKRRLRADQDQEQGLLVLISWAGNGNAALHCKFAQASASATS